MGYQTGSWTGSEPVLTGYVQPVLQTGSSTPTGPPTPTGPEAIISNDSSTYLLEVQPDRCKGS